MTALAFTFSTNGLYYVALEGTKAKPIFQSKDKISLPESLSIPELVSWFETQLEILINRIKPDNVSYKLTINNVTISMVNNCYYGQAILISLCYKKSLQISHTSPSAVVSSKFGLAKNYDLHSYIDQAIGTHPPYWDSKMKDTALISLMLLPK